MSQPKKPPKVVTYEEKVRRLLIKHQTERLQKMTQTELENLRVNIEDMKGAS